MRRTRKLRVSATYAAPVVWLKTTALGWFMSAPSAGMPSPVNPGPLPATTSTMPVTGSSRRTLWLCHAASSTVPSGANATSVGWLRVQSVPGTPGGVRSSPVSGPSPTSPLPMTVSNLSSRFTRRTRWFCQSRM